MHDTQRKLLAYAKENTLSDKTLRELGDAIGEPHPQKVKHHFEQLVNKGLIQRFRDGTYAVTQLEEENDSMLYPVPIVGSANCGLPSVIAEEDVEGYIRVSTQLVPKDHGVFAVRAIGNSMDQASINQSAIHEGDYVLIDPTDKDITNGSYVLSVIDGAANIKKYYFDETQNQILLVSESSSNIAPMVLDPSEVDYFLNGKVIRVIKPPRSFS